MKAQQVVTTATGYIIVWRFIPYIRSMQIRMKIGNVLQTKSIKQQINAVLCAI